MSEDFLMISALQHYAFCPRQFALIHLEQAWAENRFTAEGQILHERVDSGEMEKRGNVRFERSVQIESQKYKIKGKMDLLEIEEGNPPRFFPVEYKRGKPKIEDWDRVQVCAQAFCLEEMRNIKIEKAAIWYSEVRKREVFDLDSALRSITANAIHNAHEIILSGRTPMPTENKKRCKACSLIDLCEPDMFRNDCSKDYVQKIYDEQFKEFDILD